MWNPQTGDGDWEMLGLLPLFDPPRHDTKQTIEECLKKGISVKMVTGGVPSFQALWGDDTEAAVRLLCQRKDAGVRQMAIDGTVDV